jgi:hypothetical protein
MTSSPLSSVSPVRGPVELPDALDLVVLPHADVPVAVRPSRGPEAFSQAFKEGPFIDGAIRVHSSPYAMTRVVLPKPFIKESV